MVLRGTYDTHIQSHLQVFPDADARLIAAAPDLLAACKHAAEVCAIEFPGLEENSTVKMLRAAVAKAEGAQ